MKVLNLSSINEFIDMFFSEQKAVVDYLVYYFINAYILCIDVYLLFNSNYNMIIHKYAIFGQLCYTDVKH